MLSNRILVLFLGLSVLFTACSNGGDTDSNGNPAALGGKVYGGTLTISQSENVKSIFPPSIVDVYSGTIAEHVFDRLVKFNAKNLEIEPVIAESWTMDSTGTIYTFKLKQGIKFHTSVVPGEDPKELSAHDVRFSFEMMCTKSDNNIMFGSTFKDRLLGANDFYDASASGSPLSKVEGIKVIDDYTIELKLVSPFSPFLSLLAHPSLSVYSKEAYEKQKGNINIGSGPFKLASNSKVSDEGSIVLVKNNKYHITDKSDNQLPFIDTLQIMIIDSKKAELDEFEKERLHIVNGLPAESIRNIVEQQIANFQNKPPKFILDRSPTMGTEYYEFTTRNEALKDKRVRQAINYAINRTKIIDEVLKGEAYGPGENGICPPTFKGYDISKIKGYTYDLQKARELMAEAGYPNGRDFPTLKLELNSGGYKHTNVAFEVQKQLMDNLNINIDLEVVSFAQKIEDEQYSKADMFRTAWLADYPNPQNFLFIFYGKDVPQSLDEPSYPNVTRFNNAAYDSLYEKALVAKTQEESYKYLLEAEKIMIDEAPVMVLWYNEKYRLIHSGVRDYFSNPMGYKDYAQVYLKPLTLEEMNAKK